MLQLLGAADRLPPHRAEATTTSASSPTSRCRRAATSPPPPSAASDGKLYVGVGSSIRQYTYTSNSVGSTFQVSGLSGILGMSFSDDSADLYVVTGSLKLLRVNWASMTLVSGWTSTSRRSG